MTAKAHPRLILGSSSPGRLDLLRRIHIVPDIVKSADIDEMPQKGELPKPYVLRMAIEKNAVLAEEFSNDFILTGDTTIAVGRRIIGKPVDQADAEKTIRLLSGRAHKIYSAAAVRAPNGTLLSRVQISRMKVKRLTDNEIAEYLASNDWQGVSGAYRLQGFFARYFTQIQGSPSGIIGLPLYETMQMLRGLGYGT